MKPIGRPKSGLTKPSKRTKDSEKLKKLRRTNYKHCENTN